MLNNLFNLFGIQQTQTNLDNFKIAFWSGFLYTLLISILVGLFLLWLETRIAKRLIVTQNEKEIVVFKEKITTFLRLPTVIEPSDRAECWIPTNYIDIISLISNSPIQLWKNEGKNRVIPFLQKCENVSKAYEEMLIVSKSLNSIVDNKVDEHNTFENKSISSKVIFVYLNEYKNRSYGYEPVGLLRYHELLQNEHTESLIIQYKDKKTKLLSCISNLKEELN